VSLLVCVAIEITLTLNSPQAIGGVKFKVDSWKMSVSPRQIRSRWEASEGSRLYTIDVFEEQPVTLAIDSIIYQLSISGAL
jgi:hypothetical protein